MKTVRPKPLAKPLSELPLSPEEGFVLSRIDSALSVRDLVALTGIEEARVEQIVTKLASHGAVQYGPESSETLGAADDETTSLADFANALGMDPAPFGGTPRAESRSDFPPPMTSDPPPASASASMRVAEAAPTEPEEPEDIDETDPATELEERNYRKLYESTFHALPTDARVAAAQTAAGPELMALCLDADPRVVAAILENPKMGLAHARLIPFHHRTGTGLEMISRRTELVRDMGVERRLLRNPQCGEVVLSRIIATKRLQQTFKICMDREVPELTRAKSRGHLRQKWQTTPPEERADFVLRTEGRCLPMMSGSTFDARTTSILCGKPFNSVLLAQNLGKFTATPPALLAHLMKQAFIRKNVALKRLLLAHPNMPGDVKRQS